MLNKRDAGIRTPKRPEQQEEQESKAPIEQHVQHRKLAVAQANRHEPLPGDFYKECWTPTIHIENGDKSNHTSESAKPVNAPL
jgi:hypothetical protein